MTPYYQNLLNRLGPGHPVARICTPDVREQTRFQHLSDDPLQEGRFEKVPGLIHRYPDRALVLLTDRCLVYCRHCNRRRLWAKKPKDLGKKQEKSIITYIKETTSIREVILSGGDPLAVDMTRLEHIMRQTRAIDHVRVMRIGTRVPVVDPERITPALCRMLSAYLPLWINTQFNHPSEITKQSSRACQRLLRAGIPVSNQAVLLKGINDDAETLTALFGGLQETGVRPYYLFQCEPVRGAGHFRVPLKKGKAIMNEVKKRLGGLAVPAFVVDTAGRGKVRIV